MVELRKTWPICEPRSFYKFFVEDFVLLVDIVFVDMNLFSKNVDAVSRFSDILFAELVEEPQHFKADIEASVE